MRVRVRLYQQVQNCISLCRASLSSFSCCVRPFLFPVRQCLLCPLCFIIVCVFSVQSPRQFIVALAYAGSTVGLFLGGIIGALPFATCGRNIEHVSFRILTFSNKLRRTNVLLSCAGCNMNLPFCDMPPHCPPQSDVIPWIPLVACLSSGG